MLFQIHDAGVLRVLLLPARQQHVTDLLRPIGSQPILCLHTAAHRTCPTSVPSAHEMNAISLPLCGPHVTETVKLSPVHGSGARDPPARSPFWREDLAPSRRLLPAKTTPHLPPPFFFPNPIPNPAPDASANLQSKAFPDPESSTRGSRR